MTEGWLAHTFQTTFCGFAALFPTSYVRSCALFPTNHFKGYVFTGDENVAKRMIMFGRPSLGHSPGDSFLSNRNPGCLLHNFKAEK